MAGSVSFQLVLIIESVCQPRGDTTHAVGTLALSFALFYLTSAIDNIWIPVAVIH